MFSFVSTMIRVSLITDPSTLCVLWEDKAVANPLLGCKPFLNDNLLSEILLLEKEIKLFLSLVLTYKSSQK